MHKADLHLSEMAMDVVTSDMHCGQKMVSDDQITSADIKCHRESNQGEVTEGERGEGGSTQPYLSTSDEPGCPGCHPGNHVT